MKLRNRFFWVFLWRMWRIPLLLGILTGLLISLLLPESQGFFHIQVEREEVSDIKKLDDHMRHMDDLAKDLAMTSPLEGEKK